MVLYFIIRWDLNFKINSKTFEYVVINYPVWKKRYCQIKSLSSTILKSQHKRQNKVLEYSLYLGVGTFWSLIGAKGQLDFWSIMTIIEDLDNRWTKLSHKSNQDNDTKSNEFWSFLFSDEGCVGVHTHTKIEVAQFHSLG